MTVRLVVAGVSGRAAHAPLAEALDGAPSDDYSVVGGHGDLACVGDARIESDAVEDGVLECGVAEHRAPFGVGTRQS
jgi:hypothetical protein